MNYQPCAAGHLFEPVLGFAAGSAVQCRVCGLLLTNAKQEDEEPSNKFLTRLLIIILLLGVAVVVAIQIMLYLQRHH